MAIVAEDSKQLLNNRRETAVFITDGSSSNNTLGLSHLSFFIYLLHKHTHSLNKY